MKTEYRKESEHDYFIINSSRVKKGFDLTMLEENRIDHLAPLTTGMLNGHLQLYYEITGYDPLTDVFEQIQATMSGSVIRRLFGDMGRAVNETQRYFLDEEDLVFDPECIFVSAVSGGHLFCCVPGRERSEDEDLKLAEFILRHLDQEDQEAVQLGYGFYREMSAPGKRVADALRELDDLSKQMPAAKEVPAAREESTEEEIFSQPKKERHPAERDPEKHRKQLGRTGKTALVLIPVSTLAALLLTILSGADLTAAGGLFFLAGALDWLIINSVRSRENRRENLWALKESDARDDDWIEILFAGQSEAGSIRGRSLD